MAGSWPIAVRQTIADLDLNYYVPCTVRGRTIAFLGVSRTEKGEFLSSDDVELLQTLSNYVGIAIENANLYRSLKQKVEEYERLKEFSENIVESINVGILAAGLDDRVESWNTQMERLSGIGRADAVGRTLSELFPATLVEQFERTRGEMRIHHLDKFALDTTQRRIEHEYRDRAAGLARYTSRSGAWSFSTTSRTARNWSGVWCRPTNCRASGCWPRASRTR